jgi:hypothetical protein
VQWDKDDCADMGIVKVDLLGLVHDDGYYRASLELVHTNRHSPFEVSQFRMSAEEEHRELRTATLRHGSGSSRGVVEGPNREPRYGALDLAHLPGPTTPR